MNTPTDRLDPVERHYLQVETFESQADWLSWFAIAAFAMYVVLHIAHSTWDAHAKLAFVIMTCLSVVWGYWSRFAMQPVADRLRRRLLITDATGIPLTSAAQRYYWNNTETASLRRVLLNLAENTFFVPRLLRPELNKQIILVMALSLTLFFSIRFGTVEVIELVAVLILFSDLLLGKLVRTAWSLIRMRQLHLEIVAALRIKDPGQIRLAAMALYLLGEYEYIKSRANCRTSTHTFRRLNPRLSLQWEKYQKVSVNIGI